jgi:hypothetical protein
MSGIVIDVGLILPKPLAAKVGPDAAFDYYRALLADLNERSAALARNGLAGSSPDYARVVQDRFAVFGEIGLPQDQVEREMKAACDRDVIEYLAGNIVARYSSYDLREASEIAYRALHDPEHDFGLDPATRAVALQRAVRALEETAAGK